MKQTFKYIAQSYGFSFEGDERFIQCSPSEFEKDLVDFDESFPYKVIVADGNTYKGYHIDF